MRHGMVALAHTGLLPREQVSFLPADMTYRLAVGYGDDPAAAAASVEHGQETPMRPRA